MKKGFTLIELILVILLLSIIALISIPVITGITKDAKNKSYDQQLESIYNATRNYTTKNPGILPEEDEYDSSCVSVTDMQKAGVLESKDIINPAYSEECKDDEKCRSEYLNGVVIITWNVDNNKYKYTYDGSKTVCPN